MAFKLLLVTSLSLNFPVYLTARHVTQEIQYTARGLNLFLL